MTTGFFQGSKFSSRERLSTIPQCGKCGLSKTCNSPKMPVTGEGLKKVLIVAEAPGRNEDEKGIQLIGKAGQRLRDELEKNDWDLDRDCWKTNAVICHEANNAITDKHVEYCRANLLKTISELKPEVIVLLGAYAVKSLLSQEWGSDIGQMGRWAGWSIPSQRWNAWICPTFHPSYLLRQDNPALDLWFGRHIKHALGISGSPWPDGSPDWENDVEVIHDPDEAAQAIESMIGDQPVAFDYETNMLKPDSESARIVCCALSDGKTTIAYPWTGEAVQATSRFLKSKTPKVGWNIKFELRWTWRALGHGVRNWVWDGMIASHVLDNRPSITSAKFQAYVRLGLASYNGIVSPYLKASNGNQPNRIDEVDSRSLLVYCGLDALVEWKIADLQMKEMA